MESFTVQNYKDAFRTLTHKDLAQSLYDEGGIIMKEVILPLEGDAHAQRRKTEFHVFRKEIFLTLRDHRVSKNLKSDSG